MLSARALAKLNPGQDAADMWLHASLQLHYRIRERLWQYLTEHVAVRV